MKIDRIHHLNLRCAPGDLEKIENFYDEVIGLKKGQRPNFPNPGIWLYLGDHPIVHVSARCAEGFLQEKRRSVQFRARRRTESTDPITLSAELQ